VEPFDAGPIDSRFGRQGIEDFELARSGRDDDSGLATFGDGAAEDHGGEFRRIGTHSGSVGLDDDIDDNTSWQEWVLETRSGGFPMKTIVAEPEVGFLPTRFLMDRLACSLWNNSNDNSVFSGRGA
jgi:hypothetical protein